MAKSTNSLSNSKRTENPAIDPIDREEQLIGLAVNLVEKRLREGTATSQETTHFLRRAAVREKEKLELDILEEQKKLIKAKTEALESARVVEELYTDAIAAMKRYSGNGDVDEDIY